MRIGILGTGIVGSTLGSKLAQLGYEVMMGSRAANNAKAVEWAKSAGAKTCQGTFEEAAKFGDIIFLCVKGEIALDVLRLAKADNFKGKTLIDVSNPLDFSKGMPPSLLICNTNSLGEEVQRALPGANVVKTLNIVSSSVMVDPMRPGWDGTMFLSGNEANAKKEATEILTKFGWKDIMDLGDITTARATEMMLPIWLRLYGKLQSGDISFKLVRKPQG